MLATQLEVRIVVSAGERPAIDHQTQGSEGNMNEKSGNRRPNWKFLLLVPAVMFLAKGTKRRRAMWGSAWAASGAGHRHGMAEGQDSFRLPPKIEWMLDTWHTRAHQSAESTDPPTT
jgi:hypothetical protein